VAEDKLEPPFDGGAHPVREHPTGTQGKGRGVAQAIVIGIAIVVVLAALAWIFVFRPVV
jgi:ABC-type dipeptide/oligopeptide/nickel transport system permease subunit